MPSPHHLILVAPLRATRAGLRHMLDASGEAGDWEVMEAATLAEVEQAVAVSEGAATSSGDGHVEHTRFDHAGGVDDGGGTPDDRAAPTVIVLADGLDEPRSLAMLAADRSLAVVWLSERGTDPGILAGLSLAGWALLPPDASAEALWAAIRGAVSGLVVMEPEAVALLGRHVADREHPAVAAGQVPEALSPREREVLELLAQGLANKHIARRLAISEHTVKFHVSAILAKLGAASRAEAVRLGIRFGLVAI